MIHLTFRLVFYSEALLREISSTFLQWISMTNRTIYNLGMFCLPDKYMIWVCCRQQKQGVRCTYKARLPKKHVSIWDI